MKANQFISCPVCGQTPCNCTHIAEGLRDPKDNPCWKGYHPVGTKKKNGRTVPNCVPNATEGVAEGSLDEISASPDYLRAAERSRSQAKDTQRQYWKSPEEKAAARRTELKRDAGIAGYSKRHRAANPDMYPAVKSQPAPKLRDPSTEYSDDYSVWAKGRRDTMEQGVAEGSLAEGQYEMMLRNGQVKKFVAKDDADAKRIAAGHGAKSVIRLRGGVPAGKVSEQGVAEGNKEADYGPEYQDMVRRVGQRAKQGPMKTVWDPIKRVYKNVPVKDKSVKETGDSISLTMNNGSTRIVRSGMSAAGAVKSILNYLVRSKDFETLKNLKAIDGHDVTGIISKIFKPSNTIDLGEALDTEFQNFLKQAKHRYPDSKDETEAFMRYVHDELEKEGRIDRSQASDINQLEYKVNKLLASVEKLSMAKPPAPEL